jgi:excinuclease UvrABC ATPase subunit
VVGRSDPEAQCDHRGAEQIGGGGAGESTPPSRSLRSNPATVSKAFEGIRRQFAASAEARRRGLTAGWFSFNVPGGRCEKCEGIGETTIDMQFLEDLRVPCESCGGSRYREEARRSASRGLDRRRRAPLEEAAHVRRRPLDRRRLEPFLRRPGY